MQSPDNDISLSAMERKVSLSTYRSSKSARPTLHTEKSFSLSVASSSTATKPLSIAERFMSPNYSPRPLSQAETVRERDSTSIVSAAPKNGHDRPSSGGSVAPLFLSLDPSQQQYQQQRRGSCQSAPGHKSHHRKKSDRSNSLDTQKKVTQHQNRRQRQRHHKRQGKNRIDIMRVPEKPRDEEEEEYINEKETQVMPSSGDVLAPRALSQSAGIWIGSCCFIRCGEGGNSDSKHSPPLSPHLRKQRRYCCCGRRTVVIAVFLAVVAIVLIVFFLWPRTPLIRVEGAISTMPTKVTQTQQGGRTSNVAFESTWLLNTTIDNRRNFLTTRFNRIQIIAKDAMTGLLIGKGLDINAADPDSRYIPGRMISTIQLPISINYQARDGSDTTFANLMRACVFDNATSNNSVNRSNGTSGSHHSLPIHFSFTLYIFGLDWLGFKPTLTATPATGGFLCPS